jgi:hypothetical protein
VEKPNLTRKMNNMQEKILLQRSPPGGKQPRTGNERFALGGGIAGASGGQIVSPGHRLGVAATGFSTTNPLSGRTRCGFSPCDFMAALRTIHISAIFFILDSPGGKSGRVLSLHDERKQQNETVFE